MDKLYECSLVTTSEDDVSWDLVLSIDEDEVYIGTDDDSHAITLSNYGTVDDVIDRLNSMGIAKETIDNLKSVQDGLTNVDLESVLYALMYDIKDYDEARAIASVCGINSLGNYLNLDYSYYGDESMTDIAVEHLVEEYGPDIISDLYNYIDFEAYGEDLMDALGYHDTPYGLIQIET